MLNELKRFAQPDFTDCLGVAGRERRGYNGPHEKGAIFSCVGSAYACGCRSGAIELAGSYRGG